MEVESKVFIAFPATHAGVELPSQAIASWNAEPLSSRSILRRAPSVVNQTRAPLPAPQTAVNNHPTITVSTRPVVLGS
jgi:hypothetical protein